MIGFPLPDANDVSKNGCPMTEETGRNVPLFVIYFLGTTAKASVGLSVSFLSVKAEDFKYIFILSSIILFILSLSISVAKFIHINFALLPYPISRAEIGDAEAK